MISGGPTPGATPLDEFVGSLTRENAFVPIVNSTTSVRCVLGPMPSYHAKGRVDPSSPFAGPAPQVHLAGGKRGVEQPHPGPQSPRPPSSPEVASVPGWGLARTPVWLGALAMLLHGYPNRRAASYLFEGFSAGFRIPFTDCINLKSARELPCVVAKKLAKEHEAGRVAGPFLSPPLPNLRVSPLGVVPKKTPREYHLIHHLSYPKGSSVNDSIAPELCMPHWTMQPVLYGPAGLGH